MFYAKPDEYVRFRFVENPHYFELQSSKNFCAEMEKAGRPIVMVDFEVWGKGKEMQYYRSSLSMGALFEMLVAGDIPG